MEKINKKQAHRFHSLQTFVERWTSRTIQLLNFIVFRHFVKDRQAGYFNSQDKKVRQDNITHTFCTWKSGQQYGVFVLGVKMSCLSTN